MASGQIAGKQASTQKLRASHLPRNSKGKSCSQSKSINYISVLPLFPISNAAIDILAHLADDSTTTYDDKVARVLALRVRWEYKVNEEEALDGDVLQTHQLIRCRKLGLVVFRFKLHGA